MTDRGGRIVLKPGFADGLVVLRLLAGNIEPVKEFPVMPGESRKSGPSFSTPGIRAWRWRPRSIQCAMTSSKLDRTPRAARGPHEGPARGRGLGRAGGGPEGNLPPDAPRRVRQAAGRVEGTGDKEQAEKKVAILTNVQAQINDLQAMIDRYLDDDILRAYQDALERGKAEGGDKAKVPAKAAARRRLRRS